MCGRYAASASPEEMIEVFDVQQVVDDPALPPLRPRFNIAPTDPVAAVMDRRSRQTDEVLRTLARPRWGLVPSWAKDRSAAARLINARVETVAEKASFRKAFATRRCLLPADGYYEWQRTPATDGGRPGKQPWWIQPVERAGEPPWMVMAGLYEFWRDPSLPDDHPRAWLATCTIITTQANDELGRIHDRMPVQVLRRDWDDWLDPALVDPLVAHDLLHLPGPGEMTSWPVSSAVGNVRNDSPALREPVALQPGLLE
ncbi:SOS response-associated peptidase [Luteococcus sp.]|uniref:SOS response-associated peptidase n=1 Tax=Luteococcus sp. TaxID=1969402 RepID=UPI0037356B9F